MERHQAVGDQLGQANDLTGFVQLHRAQGDMSGAVEYLRQLAQLVHDSGLKQLSGMHDNIYFLAREIGPEIGYDEASGQIYYVSNL